MTWVQWARQWLTLYVCGIFDRWYLYDTFRPTKCSEGRKNWREGGREGSPWQAVQFYVIFFCSKALLYLKARKRPLGKFQHAVTLRTDATGAPSHGHALPHRLTHFKLTAAPGDSCFLEKGLGLDVKVSGRGSGRINWLIANVYPYTSFHAISGVWKIVFPSDWFVTYTDWHLDYLSH